MAATRILQAKNLHPTRDSISLLQALVSAPYAAAQALQQLATEDDSRELQPDELRYALGMLEPEQLLPNLPPTVGRIVQTFLTAENRLSQRDLADRTGVSARTIRNYRNRLEAFDLIRIDETGYRLALSFQTTSERRDPIVPTVLEENQMLLDAANAFLETLLPPERYGDPDNPLGSVLFWPPDPSRLLENEISSPIMLTIGLMSLFMIIVVLRVFSPAMAVLSPEAAESSIYQFITWRPIFSREKTAVSELIGKGYSDIFGDRISLRTGLDADKVLDMSGESYSQDDIIEYNSGCIKGMKLL